MEEDKGTRKKGLIHIYTGQGKGKTTAAVGLAVRAAGSGLRVLFVQFFKLEADSSGEKEALRAFVPDIELLRAKVRHPFFTGPDTDTEKVRASVREFFEDVLSRLSEGFDMLVMDEVLGAVSTGFLELEELIDFIEKKPESLELVLTGRDAPPELVKRADYVTEMLNIKHPFDEGTKARKGIEF